MKNLLSIDTSCPILSVSLQSSKGICEKSLDSSTKHAEHLIPFIQDLLKEQSLQLKDIDAFLINQGPGSFTGLRIGFATLKGLLAVHAKPCYAANSLDLIAYQTQEQKPPLIICLDAYSGKLYTKVFSNENDNSEILVQTHEECLAFLPESCTITGDALLRHKSIFENSSKDLKLLDKSHWYSHAKTLIEVFNEKKELLKKLKTAEDFLPLYLRKSTAEEVKEKQSQN